MKLVGTFMESDPLLKAGPDELLGALREQLNLNLVILFYPKTLWFPQILGEPRSPEAEHDAALLRDAVARTRKNGMSVWFYLGTFGERHSQLRPEFNVADVEGGFVRPDHAIPDGWTSAFSFCPNNSTLKERYQGVFQEMARDYEIDGFFIGHNRFAPPGNEFANLFGCGCADCIRAAGELGYDFAAMKQALSRLRVALRELDPRQVRELAALELGALDFLSVLGSAAPVVDWIRFRCDVIARTMSGFRAAVKEVRREIIVGQDSIPPSFSLFSGHNYRQLEDAQDYLCPNVAHPILFIVYSLAETAKHLCDGNPSLAEADVLNLVYQFFGYRRFGLPASISQLVGDLPSVEGPKDTSRTEIPLQRIVPSELRKARALSTGKVPLYTYLAFGKPDLTPEGARTRLAAAKEADYDGCILGANWTLALDRLRPHIEAVSDLVKE